MKAPDAKKARRMRWSACVLGAGAASHRGRAGPTFATDCATGIAVTFWRWRHNPALRFPEGRRVNGRWYFSRRAALEWWSAQHAEAA
jgi:hypothetical protein